jgi:rubrerythrin
MILENEIKQAIHNGTVFNLASAGEYIKTKEKDFNNTGRICGYDYKKYGLYYDDKKITEYLFDTLTDYVKLYLIYITSSSLIISNYAVRTDFNKVDIGNFPVWNLDFFERDSRRLKDISRHSHILDFDMLRLGKKLIENNRLSNAFEFGVIAITETGKERGNQYKNIEIKETIKQLRDTVKELEKQKADTTAAKAELLRLTERATQLTDKFNDALKLVRHKCTVCGFPFARVLLDEQRPESLGADARDLCEIVHITDTGKVKLTLPFYFVEELVHDIIFPKFITVYGEYRFNRGDNTLLMYLIKKMGAGIHNYHTRIYNLFGFHTKNLVIENAMTGRRLKQTPYFLSTKKIYSNRFSTDAYYDIFAKGLKTVHIGIDDIPEYKTHKAAQNELAAQNSYFVTDIMQYGGNKDPVLNDGG